MKLFKILSLLIVLTNFIACQNLVEGINEDPNKVKKISGSNLLRGIQLANVTAQSGYLNIVGNVWTGSIKGVGPRLQDVQEYRYINTNSNAPWEHIYVGVVKQTRHLRSGIPISNKDFFYGVSMILEAHALGTAASFFGDIPFEEAAKESNPKYDRQSAVYAALQRLLNSALTHLQNSKSTGGISEDLFFNGNTAKWVKVAYTLKARLYLEERKYSEALTNAAKGIDSNAGTMAYNPPDVIKSGDMNLLYQAFKLSTIEDLSAKGTYLKSLIQAGASSRNNSKTNEVDRVAYYYSSSTKDNGSTFNTETDGIAASNAVMPQISWQENLLIWAEAAVRTNDFNTALSKLNIHRKNLRDGIYFKKNTGVYQDLSGSDFEVSGLENKGAPAISKNDALLREILEERYVTFFGHILGFSDLRRTQKEQNVRVKVPFNEGSKYPQRVLYPFTESNANTNTPKIQNILEETEINK